MTWRDDALCKGQPTEWWYPERGEIPFRGLAICAECPVQAECGQYAEENRELYGVWGGDTARIRRKGTGPGVQRAVGARDRLLAELKASRSWVTVDQLMQWTGMSRGLVNTTLARMFDLGLVAHVPEHRLWMIAKEETG